jgi:hypothetical protein
LGVSAFSSTGDASTPLSARRFRILDLDVDIRSDRAETLTFLDTIYTHFSPTARNDENDGDQERPRVLDLELRTACEGPPRLDVGGATHLLADPPLTDIHVYSILLGEMFQRLGSYFLVHGAALTDGERTVLIAGPSGHGKTTLALELVGRGFRLLCDDFAPLARADGRVHPFPKRIGVKRRSDDERPQLPLEIADDREPLIVGGKWWVDPAALPGGLERRAAPLTHVLLLESSGASNGESRFRLALIHGRDEFERSLTGIEGVQVRPFTTRTGWPALEVSVDGGIDALAEFYDLCSRTRHQILYFEPCSERNGFAERAELESLTILDSAMGLMREVLNRVPGGTLLASSPGGLTGLLAELAGTIADARGAKLRVGDRRETADLVARWVTAEKP